jgi:D-alanyl-D-alanine carboxypeptidase (penicillin-binding protein 5/6)
MNIREPRDFKLIRRRRESLRRAGYAARRVFVLLLVIILTVPPFGYWRYSRANMPIPPTTFSAASKAQQVVLSWPSTAQAAVAVDGRSDVIVQGAQSAVPTASVAKVMVALLVLKKYPLQLGQTGPSITVTQKDVDNYNDYVDKGGAVIPVSLGEEISEYQVLQAIMLPSANNVADMAVVWAYGSMAAYHQAANQMAQSLGMSKSHFGGDASGMSPNTISTAHDIVLLGQEVLKNPVFSEIVAQKTADLPIIGTVANYNAVPGHDEIIGIKTGSSEEAGGCFLFAGVKTLADGQNHTVIGAIMNAKQPHQAMNEAPPLIDSAFKAFGPIKIITTGQIIAQYNLPWGGTVQAAASDGIEAFGWLGTAINSQIDIRPLAFPAIKNSVVGSVIAKSGQKTLRVPVILPTDVAAPSLKWKLFRAK